MKDVHMAFVVCGGCAASVRVWYGRVPDALPPAAAGAGDTVVADRFRRFECPRCCASGRLPLGGVYLVYDGETGRVRFVGSTRNVPRRVAWWQEPGRAYGDARRYHGVLLAASGGRFPDLAWLAAGVAQLEA